MYSFKFYPYYNLQGKEITSVVFSQHIIFFVPITNTTAPNLGLRYCKRFFSFRILIATTVIPENTFFLAIIIPLLTFSATPFSFSSPKKKVPFQSTNQINAVCLLLQLPLSSGYTITKQRLDLDLIWIINNYWGGLRFKF